MKFRLNLIRDIQEEQKSAESLRLKAMILIVACFGLLFVSLFYSLLQIYTMRSAVLEERARLARIKAEYQHYKASEMIVNKSDVELLDRLQNNRIFWSKKLLVIAHFVPDNYWITRFDYDRSLLNVVGYGYITDKQQQLVTLNEYLTLLRKEKTFNDVFREVYLNSTIRNDDQRKQARVSFNYAAVGGKNP